MMSQRILGMVCVASLASVCSGSSVDLDAIVQAGAEQGIAVMSQSQYRMTYREAQPTSVVSSKRHRLLNASGAAGKKPAAADQFKKFSQYGQPVGMVLVPNPAAKKKSAGLKSPCAAVPDGIDSIKKTVLSPCQDFDQKQPGAPVSMSAGIKMYCQSGDKSPAGIDSDKGMAQLENFVAIYALDGDTGKADGKKDAAAAPAAFLEIGAIHSRRAHSRTGGDKKAVCEKLFKSSSGGAYTGWEVKDGKGAYVKAGGDAKKGGDAKEGDKAAEAPKFRSIHTATRSEGTKGSKAGGRDHYFDDLFFDLDTQ